MSKRSSSALPTARALLAKPLSFDAFLGKLGAKDKSNITRHLAACEAEPDPNHARIWKRLACALGTLAPHATSSTGQHTLQFFVPDGKYRMQVFALDDLRDQKLVIYTTDVIDLAVRERVLAPPSGGAASNNGGGEGDSPRAYKVVGAAGEHLTVERLEASNTPDPGASFKHMLGWNRKAVRITLWTNATSAQVAAAEDLCALSALQWQGAAAAAAPVAAVAKGRS
jgi:hypothetical protein